jgi:O-antigen ligase
MDDISFTSVNCIPNIRHNAKLTRILSQSPFRNHKKTKGSKVITVTNFQKHSKALEGPAAVALFLCFPISLALGNVFFVLIALLWVCAGNYNDTREVVKSHPVAWTALALFSLVTIGSIYSSAPIRDIALDLGKYSKLLVLVLLLSVLKEEKWRRRCLSAFTFSMAFILFSAYASFWLDLPWSKTRNQGFGEDHTVVGDHITQNIQMCFFVQICFYKLLSTKSLTRKSLWIGMAILACFSMTFLSAGRSGYGLLAATLIFLSLFNSRWRYRALALAALMIISIATYHSSDILQQRVQKGLTEIRQENPQLGSSFGSRIFYQKRTLSLALEHPILGWGSGSYHTEFCRNLAQAEWCKDGNWHPHNQYLQFWMQNGILGLALFCILIALPILLIRNESIGPRRLTIGFSLIFFLNSFFNCSLWSSRESHFFIFILALLTAGLTLRKQVKTEKQLERA